MLLAEDWVLLIVSGLVELLLIVTVLAAYATRLWKETKGDDAAGAMRVWRSAPALRDYAAF
jgi:hypothetical protein